MKIFNSRKSEIGNLLGINTVVNVEQLTAFDMIYVYHLISEGTKLNCFQTETKLNGDLVYKVMFNTFHLGFVTISNFSKTLFQGHFELDATVFGLGKEKYLPLKSMEVIIKQNTLKMVS